MPSADAIPAAGEVLADKYRIDRVLGRGGMGVVLGAHHLHLDERVAIKFLLPELAHDASLVARFLREGRASIKIRSEHVVRVLDVSTMPGGTPYMVLEYLDGSDLGELLAKKGKLPIETATDYLLQSLEALAEAHALGMVHRDLKPSNLFLVHRVDGSACVKVLDFGITKVSSTEANLGMTKTNAVMGSPHYMSPEQMRSTRTVDARADIWALGIILHELLSGSPPFEGTTMPELLVKILQDEPPPLQQVRPDAPRALEQVVSRCLKKDPNERYGDVAELATALAAFGSPAARASADCVARVLASRGEGAAAGGRLTSGSSGSTEPPKKRTPPTAGAWASTGKSTRSPTRTVATAGGGLALCAIVAALLLLTRGSRSTHDPLSSPVAASPPATTAAAAISAVATPPPPAPPTPSAPAASATPTPESPQRPALAEGARPARHARTGSPAPSGTPAARATAPAGSTPATGNDLFDGRH
jgi:serine/threonine protein kinase